MMPLLPETMAIPSVRELLESTEEASIEALRYWDSKYSVAENHARFRKYVNLKGEENA